MLNQVSLLGRFTVKPELQHTGTGIPYCRFRLAVDKDYTNQDGNRSTDFINCIIWRPRPLHTVALRFRRKTSPCWQTTMRSCRFSDYLHFMKELWLYRPCTRSHSSLRDVPMDDKQIQNMLYERKKTMKNQKMRRLLHCSLLLVLAVSLLTLPAHAADGETSAGDIASVVDGIWQNASGQMKTICNNVVFPALSWVCGIGFVISVVVAIFNYKKHHTVEVGWPIALLLGLIVCLTASTWVWALIGA